MSSAQTKGRTSIDRSGRIIVQPELPTRSCSSSQPGSRTCRAMTGLPDAGTAQRTADAIFIVKTVFRREHSGVVAVDEVYQARHSGAPSIARDPP